MSEDIIIEDPYGDMVREDIKYMNGEIKDEDETHLAKLKLTPEIIDEILENTLKGPLTKKELMEAMKDVPDNALICIRMVWCNAETLLDYKLNVKDGCHPVFEIREDFSDE